MHLILRLGREVWLIGYGGMEVAPEVSHELHFVILGGLKHILQMCRLRAGVSGHSIKYIFPEFLDSKLFAMLLVRNLPMEN